MIAIIRHYVAKHIILFERSSFDCAISVIIVIAFRSVVSEDIGYNIRALHET